MRRRLYGKLQLLLALQQSLIRQPDNATAENRVFVYPTCIVPSEYCHNVWYGKTRMVWLLDGEKKLKIYLFVSTEST